MPSLSSLAQSLGLNAINERVKSSVGIEELKEDDSPVTDGLLRLQYFPESISDHKAVNWVPRDIPGGSLPLYQWVSSGERTLSFTAIFTTDVDFSEEANGSDLAVSIRDRLKGSAEEGRNQDIRTAIMWLRRFMLPRYDSETQVGTPLTRAPRKLRLIMPGTGIGWAGGAGNGTHTQRDSIIALMTGCEVEWVQFFPSGFPRIATVALSFAQTPQFQQTVQFPAPDPAFDRKVYVGDGFTFPYTIK